MAQIGTCWAQTSWAVPAWAAGTWAGSAAVVTTAPAGGMAVRGGRRKFAPYVTHGATAPIDGTLYSQMFPAPVPEKQATTAVASPVALLAAWMAVFDD